MRRRRKLTKTTKFSNLVKCMKKWKFWKNFFFIWIIMQKYHKDLRFEKKLPFFRELWNMFDFWNVADKMELTCPNPIDMGIIRTVFTRWSSMYKKISNLIMQSWENCNFTNSRVRQKRKNHNYEQTPLIWVSLESSLYAD